MKLAARLISAGLAIQLLSLWTVHPLSFMAFLLIGSPLVLGGVVLYLFGLLSAGMPAEQDPPAAH